VVGLLTEQCRVKEEIAKTVATLIWERSANIRDCVKIARMAKSIEDVMFIADTFLKYTSV
jgi:phosphate uptake regulator